MRRRLLAACERHVISERGEHTVLEPYVPRIPDNWNGRIVLAEAQNHGSRSSAYVAWLLARGHRGRMRRLDFWEHGVGIQPWDNGTLKLAVEAAFGGPADRWAVSNAVLWSRVARGGGDGKPSAELIRRSVAAWVDFLRILQPDHVVTAGRKAGTAIGESLRRTGLSALHTALESPSPKRLCSLSRGFDPDDLLQRFPAAAHVIRQHPDWLGRKNTKHKVFFTCHAVSVATGVPMVEP